MASATPIERIPIDPHMASVVLIEIVLTGKAPKSSRMGTATGFFFQYDGRRFLITNKHVVVNKKEEFYPDRLIVRIHASKENVDSTRDIELPLYDAKGNALWLEHPTQDADLAVLEVSHLLQDTDMVLCWTEERLLPPRTRVSLGTQVFVIGYPMGLFEPKFYLPIVRTGTLATTYGLGFHDAPICLIDANLHPGTSGSPVLLSRSLALSAVEDPSILRDYPSFLLGVNSGTYSIDGVGLELNAVWYGRLILEILSRTHKESESTAETLRSEST